MVIGLKKATAGYGWLSMSLHWLMLLLIVVTYAAMDLKFIFPKGSSSREAMAVWHYMLGISIFCLVWLRLWARASGADPAIEPALPGWQALFMRVMHWALYVLMIAMPLLGWLTLNAKGTPVTFLGTELPALIGKSQVVAKWFKEVHGTVATIGYFLIGFHAAAALYHHYVKRDNTLRLMLPGR